MSRRTVSEVLHEKRPLTPEIAHRVGKFLGHGPNLWLNMQMTLDMWDALHQEVSGLERVVPLERDSVLSGVASLVGAKARRKQPPQGRAKSPASSAP